MVLAAEAAAPDLAALFEHHVRLRPITSTVKPGRRDANDLFGFLVDFDSGTHVGLRVRHSGGVNRAVPFAGYTISPYPYRRAHVFQYQYFTPDDTSFWTWCREIGGDVLDSYSGLDRFAGRDEAFAAAAKWLSAWAEKDLEASQ